jgi:hypothetical protein
MFAYQFFTLANEDGSANYQFEVKATKKLSLSRRNRNLEIAHQWGWCNVVSK